MTEEILNYDGPADIISLMIGTNDFGFGLPLGKWGDKTNDTFYGSLYLICEHFEENYPNSFIFFMTPAKTRSTINKVIDGHTLNDFAEALRFYAKRYNYPLLDMYYESGFEDIEMNLPESDGTHPSQSFHEEHYVPKIVEFIRKNTDFL